MKLRVASYGDPLRQLRSWLRLAVALPIVSTLIVLLLTSIFLRMGYSLTKQKITESLGLTGRRLTRMLAGAATSAGRTAITTALLITGALDELFERHRFVRRFLVFWSIWIITFVTFQVFADVSQITTAAAAAYATIVGVLGVVLGFYQWMRDKDNDR